MYHSVMNGQSGPARVFPGRLSVSRTFGDIEAKDPNLGGMKNVVIAEPQIKVMSVNHSKDDFIILGCDGIFDVLTSNQVVDESWRIPHLPSSSANLH